MDKIGHKENEMGMWKRRFNDRCLLYLRTEPSRSPGGPENSYDGLADRRGGTRPQAEAWGYMRSPLRGEDRRLGIPPTK